MDLFNEVVLDLDEPPHRHFLDALREVHAVIVSRMVMRKSSLLRAPYPAEIDFSAGEQAAPLPYDFKALDGRPFTGDGKPLAPLGQISLSTLRALGSPRYYSLAGRSLRLHPTPDTPVVVSAPYFIAVPAPESMSDDLPFDGEFDQAYISGCRALLSEGISAIASKAFVVPLQAMVDVVIEAAVLAEEQSIADGINDLR
jgi:hypothetical protein